MIVISGATVIAETGNEVADVLIRDREVIELGSPSVPNGATVIEGHGLTLGPGLVDMHAHFRDPGQVWKEDLESGSRAAAAGGFTAVVAMPNTVPAIDTAVLAQEVMGRARALEIIEVTVAGAITSGRHGVELADIEAMYEAGVRIFTDDGDSVADDQLLMKAMSVVSQLPGAIVAQHAEDAGLTRGGHMHEGRVSAALGIRGLPVSGEVEVIERDIGLSDETRAHLHIQHVSSRAAVELIREAKRAGKPVTAEVTPHHLTLTDEHLRQPDPNLKMYPPLRSEADRDALRQGLRDGVIDVVATDHAPHTPSEKMASFADAPRGVIGLETAMSLTLQALEGDLPRLFQTMSLGPARLARLDRHGRLLAPGAPANLVLIDPHSSHEAGPFLSKSENSPFLGQILPGTVVATICEGRIVYQRDER